MKTINNNYINKTIIPERLTLIFSIKIKTINLFRLANKLSLRIKKNNNCYVTSGKKNYGRASKHKKVQKTLIRKSLVTKIQSCKESNKTWIIVQYISNR